jgi:hypothetical protein
MVVGFTDHNNISEILLKVALNTINHHQGFSEQQSEQIKKIDIAKLFICNIVEDKIYFIIYCYSG